MGLTLKVMWSRYVPIIIEKLITVTEVPKCEKRW
jgi:hypothetical protein